MRRLSLTFLLAHREHREHREHRQKFENEAREQDCLILVLSSSSSLCVLCGKILFRLLIGFASTGLGPVMMRSTRGRSARVGSRRRTTSKARLRAESLDRSPAEDSGSDRSSGGCVTCYQHIWRQP